MSNRIPRKANFIVGKMLMDTNLDKKGDILHVSKNDYGWSALNIRTQKYGHMFIDMLRNEEIFKLINIE